jgi:hypothetical protein
MLNFAPCTWSDIAEDLNPENARLYTEKTDKLVFCADLTGLSVDSRLLARFENELEKMAIEHGYMDCKEGSK